MTLSDPAAQKASDTFRRLLDDDPVGTRQEYDAMVERMRKSGLMVGDRVIPLSFAPALISRARLEPINREMAQLMKILIRLEPILHRPRWMELLGISPEERDLIRLPASLPHGSHVSRVDGFLGPPQSDGDTGYRIVELNIDSPGGAAFMDAAWNAISETETWKRFRQHHPGSFIPSDPNILEVLLNCWKAWGGAGNPRIAIVDWVTVSTHAEFALLRDHFKSRDIDTVVCDPRELEFKNGHLVDYDGKQIELVYRRVLVEDLLARGEEARSLLDAYRAGAVCMVNPFRAKPLTIKSLLALFHRSEMEELLDADDIRFIRRIVPWTAIVEDGPVVDTLIKRRSELVLKPADGWGGDGIYLGWELTDSDWEAAVKVALSKRYVAQERVFIPQAEHPVPTEKGWEYHDFRVDFDPYLFSQKIGVPLMRLSGSDMLNIKTGGQLAVTWVLWG